ATNYLADAGVSGASTSYSFNVPAGATFIVVVNEVNSGGGIGANYTLTIDGLCLPCNVFSGSSACCPTITLSPSTVPSGVSGAPYPPTVITPSGGVAPYTFNTISNLPPGMTATPSSTSLTLSGTPIGSFAGTIVVSGKDANGCPFSQSYSLTITCDPALTAQATITATSPVCVFSTNTATVTIPAGPDPPGTTITWTITNGTITARPAPPQSPSPARAPAPQRRPS